MKIKTFMDSDFREFSTYDTVRSLPCIVDGFKPSQRKAMYGLIKKGAWGPEKEQKVAQVAAYIADVSDYHHGEDSLSGTIVGMAQTYPGSNNINLLHPEGQFGSRLTAQAAAARYIFTYIDPNFKKVFKSDDDIILDHLDSDGMKIEPRYYLPILPMVLVNGAKGMGTGYACDVLSYNPRDLINNIKTILNGKTPRKELVPWYKGFNGTIYRNEGQSVFEGKYEIVNTTTIRITELPIGTYLDKYKEHLLKLKESGVIKDFDDDSTEEGFYFTITIPRATAYLDDDKIMTKFKLRSRTTENLTLWDENGFIRVYDSIQSIIDSFVMFRLQKYEDRRLKKIELLNAELDWLNEKLRFIMFYLDNHAQFAKKGKAALFKMLEQNEFNQIDRLLNMRIYTLTKDEIQKLKGQIKEVKLQITAFKKTTSVDMYVNELEELKSCL